MKKIFSTMEVFAGLSGKRMFAVLGGMAALELILFWIFGLSRQGCTFENAVRYSFVPWVFGAAYFVMFWALAWLPGRKIQYRYTLQRLTVSERAATVIQTVYYAFCFLLFLLTQVVLLLIMAKLFENGRYFTEGPQGIFVDVRWNFFLRRLIPLWNVMPRVVSALCIVFSAIAAAHMNVMLRRGKTPTVPVMLAAATAYSWGTSGTYYWANGFPVAPMVAVVLIAALSLSITYSVSRREMNTEDDPWD